MPFSTVAPWSQCLNPEIGWHVSLVCCVPHTHVQIPIMSVAVQLLEEIQGPNEDAAAGVGKRLLAAVCTPAVGSDSLRCPVLFCLHFQYNRKSCCPHANPFNCMATRYRLPCNCLPASAALKLLPSHKRGHHLCSRLLCDVCSNGCLMQSRCRRVVQLFSVSMHMDFFYVCSASHRFRQGSIVHAITQPSSSWLQPGSKFAPQPLRPATNSINITSQQQAPGSWTRASETQYLCLL